LGRRSAPRWRVSARAARFELPGGHVIAIYEATRRAHRALRRSARLLAATTLAEASRIFRLAIDEDTLTDELFAFVSDPRSTRYQRRVLTEMGAIAPAISR
jgi:hypothetical protein